MFLIHLRNPWDPYLWNLHGTTIEDRVSLERLLLELEYFGLGLNMGVGQMLITGLPALIDPDPGISGIDLANGVAKLRDSATVATLRNHRRSSFGHFGQIVPLAGPVRTAYLGDTLSCIQINNGGIQGNVQFLGGTYRVTMAPEMQRSALVNTFPGLGSVYGPSIATKIVS